MPKKTTAAATATKTTEDKPKVDNAAKQAARQEQNEKQLAYVVEHYVDGDEPLAAVAKALSITSGKAAFLAMQHRVAQNEVPAIKGKDDDALLKAISAARNKADEYSSWGWLAARSGKSEGFIKTGLAELGLFEPRAENIASKRAESKPKAAPKPKAAAATGGKKKTAVKGNA